MLTTADLMGVPPPPTDTIYVANIPVDTDEKAIAKHFSQIGVIKQDKLTNKDRIYMYKDEGGTLSVVVPVGARVEQGSILLLHLGRVRCRVN